MKNAARWVAVVVAVVLVASPLTAGAASEAERQRQIQQEIDRLRDELDEVASEEAEVLADLRVTQRRKTEEESRLSAIDQQTAKAAAELGVAEAKLDSAIAAELEAKRKLDHVEKQLDGARRDLKDQAVASFIRFGSGAERLDVLLRADSLAELHDAAAFIDAVAERQARIVDRFAALEDDAAALEAHARDARAEAAVVHGEVEARARALQEARTEQAVATAAATEEAAREQRLLESLRGQRAQYERRIREQQAASDAITELLRRRSSGGPTISGRGSLGAPLSSPVITSTYGYRVHPIFGDRRLHTGLDFRAPMSMPILSAGAGEVIYAGWRSGYGNTTIIDHGGGVATLYAHQSAFSAAAGTIVRRGQQVGEAGATGFATGPHLHFEVRVNGAPVDPLPYL